MHAQVLPCLLRIVVTSHIALARFLCLPPTHHGVIVGCSLPWTALWAFGSCRFDPIRVPRFSLILRRSSRLPNLPPAAAPGGLPNATAACGRWCEVTEVLYLTRLNIRSSPFKFVLFNCSGESGFNQNKELVTCVRWLISAFVYICLSFFAQ